MIDSHYEVRSAELAIIISYPTSASGIIVLLKTPPTYRKLDYNKNKKAQKNHAYMYAVRVCRSWYKKWLITHDGLANQNSRIALSNDPVFNNGLFQKKSTPPQRMGSLFNPPSHLDFLKPKTPPPGFPRQKTPPPAWRGGLLSCNNYFVATALSLVSCSRFLL